MRVAPCPDENVLIAYGAGTLSDDEAERFEEHYFSCERCWKRLERVLELRGALAGGAVRPATRPRLSRALWPGLAAAAVLAAVAIGLWGLMPNRPGTVRGDGDIIAPVVTRVDEGVEASWDAVEGTDVYLIEIFAADGELVLSREVREPRVAIARAELDPTGTMYFKVQALGGLRQPLAVSGLVEIAGPAP